MRFLGWDVNFRVVGDAAAAIAAAAVTSELMSCVSLEMGEIQCQFHVVIAGAAANEQQRCRNSSGLERGSPRP